MWAWGLYARGMITFNCDRCERTLEVGDELAGTKVQCPYCGDVNVVPRVIARSAGDTGAVSGGTPQPRDRAAAMGLPPDAGPETRVMKVRPAMFRARPMLFSVLTLAAVGGTIGAAVFAFRGQAVWAYLCGAAAAAGLVALGVWKIKTLGVALEITNKRTIESRGLLSRATSEVLHDDIKNLQITQTFWQRVWNVGTVGISSAGQDDIEITAQDMPRPAEIKRVIDAYRNRVNE